MKRIILKINEETQTKVNALMEECKVFFAYSDKQFMENKTELQDGEKYVSIGHGGYMPKSMIERWKNGNVAICKWRKDEIKKADATEDDILCELLNRECFYTGDISDVVDLFTGDYTAKEVRDVYNKFRVKYHDL